MTEPKPTLQTETWRPSLTTRLYDLAGPAGEFLLKAVYKARFYRWCRERAPSAVLLNARTDLYQYLLSDHGLDRAVDYLEFGVYYGESLRWWAGRNQHPDARFYGFDTFTGLPEQWVGLPEGTFSTGGQMPDFDDGRVSLVVGLFQETLADFLDNHALDRRMVIHIDSDLYSAALYVLTMLAGRFKKGDVIIFDELGSGYGVSHEFRALLDFESAYGFRYKLLGGADQYVRAAIEVV